MLPSRPALALERALGRLTDAFIAVSASEADFAARERVVPAGRIHLVANGIELEPPARPPTADLRGPLGIGADVPLVGMVGRLAPQKAPEVFLAACAELSARVPEARFVLIGDGPMREEVAGAIRASGLQERVLHIPGLQDAFTVMPQLDVFALSSRYEAGPYAPLEAMRAGVPVVLTDVPGNRDTVVDERTGLRVPADDPGALAAAVERLLAEPELAARLAAAAREDLAARFDVRRTGARTLEVYRSLLRS
jgi:glycosyltransferase involved in cell wall biosynthesis